MSNVFLSIGLRRCCVSALILLVLCVPLFAQSVVTLSEDGRQAWYTPSGMSTGTLADRIIRLSGDSPTPPTDPPTDPTDPPIDPIDQWGLIAVSETAALNVRGDPKHSETAGKLMAAYVTIGNQYQDGTIQRDQLKPVLELAFKFATRPSSNAWEPWHTATQVKYNSIQFRDVQKAGQGVIDIGIGVGRTSSAPQHAISDFFEWFLKLLPFLMTLIEIFGGSNLDAMLEAAAGGA